MEFKILTKLSYQQVQRIRMKKMKNIVEKLGFSPDSPAKAEQVNQGGSEICYNFQLEL